MKKIGVVLFLLVTLTSIGQSKSSLFYDGNAQKRNVPNFKGVKVSSAIDLYLSQGDVNEVAVSASSNEVRDRIITEVVGGILIIKFENSGWRSWSWGNNKMKAYVSIKDIESLQASGASNVKITGDLVADKLSITISGASDLKNANIKAGQLKLDASGASDMKANIAAQTLSIEASGASSISLSGSIDDAVVECNGASNVKAYDLIAKAASLKASGASDIQMTINVVANLDASGASSIKYKGNAIIKKNHAAGASHIYHND